jgi:membrane fusion protein (multidrug efflux system)
MRLRFTVPQTDISRINIRQQVDIKVDAYPEGSFEGSISAIEPAVSVQSGLVQVQADIPNNDGRLRSGMFARANIILPTIENQVTYRKQRLPSLYMATTFISCRIKMANNA